MGLTSRNVCHACVGYARSQCCPICDLPTPDELAALREELARYKVGHERLGGTIEKVVDVAPTNKQASELLQKRLTAAEQRNAVMTKALERITRPHDCGCVPCTGSCTSKIALEITLEEIREIAGAALNPTESGARE